MLIRASELRGCSLHSKEMELGIVRDIAFRERRWRMSYLICQLGLANRDREAIVAPAAIMEFDFVQGRLELSVGRDELLAHAALPAGSPVSSSLERAASRALRWPLERGKELGGKAHWVSGDRFQQPSPIRMHAPASRRLLRFQGFGVRASDGQIGRIDDLIVDSREWRVTHLMCRSEHRRAGPPCYVDPGQIAGIDWYGRSVLLSVARATLLEAASGTQMFPI